MIRIDKPKEKEINMAANQVELYNRQSAKYGKRRNRKGIDYKWRKELLQGLGGRILEVAVGAGANFQFYDKNAQVTAVDISPGMMNYAKLSASESRINAFFLLDNVENMAFEPDSFDAIVSTFSLCAYKNPRRLLDQFNTWCKSNGQILLLEHGLSKYDLMQWGQKMIDPIHYKMAGCHMKRNIVDLVKMSGLNVVKIERKMLGMIYIVRATPNRSGVSRHL